MCKLLRQYLLHFRWKLSEIKSLNFFSRMKNKEGFFLLKKHLSQVSLPVYWNVHESQRSSVGVCVLLHEGVYQPFESRSSCLGGKGCAWQHSKSHQASLLVALWTHQDFVKIYAHCLIHLIVCCSCVEPCLIFGCGKQLLGKIFLIMLTFEGK